MTHLLDRDRFACAAVCAAALSLLAGTCAAQTNVRAWHARGQVWVVWDAGANPPLTFSVYRSAQAFSNTADAILTGRLFRPEWEGERLRLANPAATWVIPTPQGTTYTLHPTEGLFVFTPHSAGTEYFAVVRTGSAAVAASNRTPVAIGYSYDPDNDPIIPHRQLSGSTTEGLPFHVYAAWADGRADHTDARPDFPVGAGLAKNGAPSVFGVFEPAGGIANVPAPYPLMVALHGGGGAYVNWRPGNPNQANVNTVFPQGLWITHDDVNYVANRFGTASETPTFWFGYAPSLDPFALPTPLADGTLVVNYTLRRLEWFQNWLLSRSIWRSAPGSGIDPARVSITGHSMGGQGTLLFSRFRPDLFASATAFNPGLIGAGDSGGATNLIGTEAQNLPTNLIGPGGRRLGVTDCFYAENRISPTIRDLCFSRIYLGRYDQNSNANWNAGKIDRYTNMNAAAWGWHLYWDQRQHAIDSWNTPTNIPGLGTAIAQWVVPPTPIAPGQTRRDDSATQTRYRSDQSFPAFFDDDQNLISPGRQPSIGGGDPNDGDPWGTWSGYFDWDQASIFDTPGRWACNLFATGQSSTAVDNAPFTAARASVAVRRPQAFNPAPGTTLYWAQRRVPGGGILDSGLTIADTTPGREGLVTVRDLIIGRDPVRSRLIISTTPICLADVDDGSGTGTLDGGVGIEDLVYYLEIYAAGTVDADLDNGSGTGTVDGAVSIDDLLFFLSRFAAGC